MTSTRVMIRVDPYDHEDVYGYLSRVAQTNHLGGLGYVFQMVFDCRQRPVDCADVGALAHFCRLYPEEMAQLSGISKRSNEGARWRQVHGQWLTKEPFVASRQVRVCPKCLAEAAYVRGIWSLTFYTACTRHQARLISACPQCLKPLKWNRQLVRYCSCRCDLSIAGPSETRMANLIVAAMVEQQCGEDVGLDSLVTLSDPLYQRLSCLSLDGLCKTLWFLGHCLGEFGRYGAGHGRFKPRAQEADVILANSMDIFQDWPHRLGEKLSSVCLEQPITATTSRGALIERLLGPVQNYLKSELQEDQFRFLTVAYEGYIQGIWKAFGKAHSRHSERQLHLDFDD